MGLFIVSEVMFFFSFFLTFFHVSLSPAIEIGSVWPPVGFEGMVLSYQKVPLLNTLLLLSSGVSVTYAHSALHANFEHELNSNAFVNPNTVGGEVSRVRGTLWFFEDTKWLELSSLLVGCSPFISFITSQKYNSVVSLCRGIQGMWITLLFAILFIMLQVGEYLEAVFNISDSSYGSTFFVMTGFHGLHVIVGTIFLVVCLYRLCFENFFLKGSTGLECAIWYWHFVDVVWLFLYISIYWWGNICSHDVFSEATFNIVAKGDAVFIPNSGFQDPATNVMESIISLYNYVYIYLVFITFTLLFILFGIWDQ